MVPVVHRLYGCLAIKRSLLTHDHLRHQIHFVGHGVTCIGSYDCIDRMAWRDYDSRAHLRLTKAVIRIECLLDDR